MRAMRRFWPFKRDPKPRTYSETCEELGGVPWRKYDGTEQWFLVEEPRPATPRPMTLDTARVRIESDSVLVRAAHSPLAWLALAACAVAIIVAQLVGSRGPRAPAVVVAAPAPVAAAPAPVAAAPVATPPAPVVAAPRPHVVAAKKKVAHKKKRIRRRSPAPRRAPAAVEPDDGSND
jgi:hypothetical protein